MNALPKGNCNVSFRFALERLDLLLHHAISVARQTYTNLADHPFRGLCVTDEEVDKLLLREPMRPSLWYASGDDVVQGEVSDAAVVPLKELLGLSNFELDVVLIALAPELDLKYERLFAYLNDDLNKKWPTVDLVLNILCASSEEKLAMHRQFSTRGRLFSMGLLHFSPFGEDNNSLLSRRLKLDPIVVRFLCGEQTLGERLNRFCTQVVPTWSLADLPVTEQTKILLSQAITQARHEQPVHVYMDSQTGCGQEECAESLASALDAQLLIADLSRIPDQEHHKMLRLVLLQARLFGLVPCFKGTVWSPEGDVRDLISTYPGTIIFNGLPVTQETQTITITIELARPGYEQRHVYWCRQLNNLTLVTKNVDVDQLASLFELNFTQIRATVTTAQQATQCLGRALTTEDLMLSARKHSSHALAEKAILIEPDRRWTDLILSDDAKAQLRELCDRVRRRQRVLEHWGFGRERRGTGINALFVGSSGTGKTLAAEVVAADLGLNLYRIDLAAVVSKYIGETEKNLDSIFQGAEQSNAVLLFDEADALFGKRSTVRDAHDRYANVEVAYLLQRLESYPGVAILTTNLSDNLDQAFTRRLAYTVHFPFPGVKERQRIWETVWPPEAPLASDFQSKWLAERFKLTGGNIRNIALTAACLVADESDVINMTHVLHALRREFHKMGKSLTETELVYPAIDIQVAAV